MIIIDYSAIAVSNIVTQRLDIQEDMIRHMILNSIRMYRSRFRDKFGEVVMAGDAGNNWRYNEFPQYKAARKKTRKESKMDWKEAFRIINLVWEELGEHFPYKTVKIDGCEADDVIGVLVEQTQEFGQHEPVIIISADKDFAQLQKYKNVSQFSPMTKKFIKEDHPRKQLLELVLKGDTADGVPNVLSDDNVFVNGGRQTPLRKPIIEALMHDPSSQGETVLRNIQRNRKLIDLESTPAALREKIIYSYDGQNKAGNKGKVFPYLVDKRCRRLLEDVKDFI
tara:strand:- start:229 stop:1071 length:843 start_codon:yes stop_codon:yes gene_type:complete